MSDNQDTWLRALCGSIKQWGDIITKCKTRSLKESDVRMGNCPLCQLYHPAIVQGGFPLDGRTDTYCLGCPVRDRVGQYFCKGTPEEAFSAHVVESYEYMRDCDPRWDGLTKLAVEEREFLISLLPEYDICDEEDGECGKGGGK